MGRIVYATKRAYIGRIKKSKEQEKNGGTQEPEKPEDYDSNVFSLQFSDMVAVSCSSEAPVKC